MSTFINNRVDLVIAHDELTTVNTENQRKINLDATLGESSTDPCCTDNGKQEIRCERSRRSLSMTPLHNPCEYVPVYANRITIKNGGDDFEISSRNALGAKCRVKDADATLPEPEKKEFVRNAHSHLHPNNRKFQRNSNTNANRRSLYCDSTFDNNSSNEAIYNLYRPASYTHLVELPTSTTTTPKQFSNNGNNNNLVKLNQLGDKSTTVIIKSSDLNYRSIKLKKREKQLKLSSSLSSDSASDITVNGGGQLHRARTEENISNIVVDDEPIIGSCLKRSDMKSCEVLSRDETNEDEDEKSNDNNRIRILVNEHLSSSNATAKPTNAGNASNSTSYVEGKS